MENKRIVAWMLLLIGLISPMAVMPNMSDAIAMALLLGFVLGGSFALGISYIFNNPKNNEVEAEAYE